MTAFRTSPADALWSIYKQVSSAEQQIDIALDRADRRAFTLWCKKRNSLMRRIEAELLEIATAR